MKTRKKQKQNWLFPNRVFNVFLVFIMLLFAQLCYLSLSPSIYGINMDEFAANRNTTKETLYASRGTIYDMEGNTLALNMTSYTVIAYLSENRTGSSPVPLHVQDKHMTAEKLSPLLNMSVEYIEELLNRDVYQVELGPGGRGITELEKDAIAALNLPGIDFVESYIRRYPNGDFASYVLGYAKANDDGDIVGELGIEAMYNDILKGTNGSLIYQRDRFGYKIPDTKEYRIDAVDGANIYLTIDSNIQRFVESAVKETAETYTPEWLQIAVMDAKNGNVLATATSPSFNPNIRDIVNYENPLVSYLYEPGSVMKTYTYMCAMEKGTYDGNKTYQSGYIKIGDDTVSDWNNHGWGVITFDKGYEYSSNVGVSNMMQSMLNKGDLKDCLEKYGFGEETGIELPRELVGSLSFNYPIEVATAAFGQGITTTAIQQLQALTIIANNGKMLKPHIVSKIVNPNTNEVIYEGTKEESEQLVSETTVNKMKDLMHNVIYGTDSGTTGRSYQIAGYDIIGKTGTAQIFDNNTGRYLNGTNDYIYSFAGMYPKDNPEIIIYGAMRRPSYGTSVGLSNATKAIMISIAKYKNMFNDQVKEQAMPVTSLSSYLSQDVKMVKSLLESLALNVTVIGNGDKVISQYPAKGSKVVAKDRVILITNGQEITMPDLTGWSSSEVSFLFNKLNVKFKLEGYGYVTEQSIKVGESVYSEDELIITLKDKYQEEPTT